MKTATHLGAAAVIALSLLCARSTAAAPILNGGFETGLANWTTANQLGSDGSFFVQSGTVSPVTGDAVPAPPAGVNAAMTEALGPGSHVLYQDFLVDSPAALLRFDLFLGNRGGLYATANPATVGLDFSTPALNQQFRADILKSTANPFSVAAADVLQNLYQTAAGDPLVSGYTTLTFDLGALFAANPGQTLRLRFAETDNLGALQAGIDNVSLRAVPEPASLLLLGTGIATLLVRRRAHDAGAGAASANRSSRRL
jgi:hypothetical protein